MASAEDSQFDDAEFERAVIRIVLDEACFELRPVPSTVVHGSGLPITGTIHVISACNPGFRESDDVNEQRHVELEQRLQDASVDYRPAVGMSADRTWVEPSWAVVGLDRKRACEIGRDFGQVAVFEIVGHAVRVVRCVDQAVLATHGYEATSATNL